MFLPLRRDLAHVHQVPCRSGSGVRGSRTGLCDFGSRRSVSPGRQPTRRLSALLVGAALDRGRRPPETLVAFTLTGLTEASGNVLFDEEAPGLTTPYAQFALDVLDDSSAIIGDDVFTVPTSTVDDFGSFDRDTGIMYLISANGFRTDLEFFFGVDTGIKLQLQLTAVPEPAALPTPLARRRRAA